MTSKAINVRLVEAEATTKMINETREGYRVVATRIEDFAQRHPLQQHSQQKEFLAFQLAHPHAVSR